VWYAVDLRPQDTAVRSLVRGRETFAMSKFGPDWTVAVALKIPNRFPGLCRNSNFDSPLKMVSVGPKARSSG
jgi:hypothetical protein